MQGSTFGSLLRVTTFGESHGVGVGVVIDGLPSQVPITESEVQKEMDRRRPGQSDMTTPRKESDTVRILSGIYEDRTTGTPMAIVLYNKDANPGAYEDIKDLFRPGHADRTYLSKYGVRDFRGSGRASGRETAGRVAAGAVAKKVLSVKGITITAYTQQVGNIKGEQFLPDVIEKNPLRAADPEAAAKMEDLVRTVKEENDSIGGIVECRISGVPEGLGEPVFDKLDARLAAAMVSIGSVKGIEFGTGFSCVSMRGTEHNDQMTESGFLSNNAGGIIGGISNGNQIVFRVAVKPTASVASVQKTVNTAGEAKTVITEGRHDPCICPRIVPVIESMAALSLLDFFLMQQRFSFA
ncbi:MAG: chorismate synthase [Spirochaetia bacterium]